jgi:hypothetical protein
MRFQKNGSFFRKKKKQVVKSTKVKVKNEDVTSGCSHVYGYLASRPKNFPIPQECLFCFNVIDCLYKTKK